MDVGTQTRLCTQKKSHQQPPLSETMQRISIYLRNISLVIVCILSLARCPRATFIRGQGSGADAEGSLWNYNGFGPFQPRDGAAMAALRGERIAFLYGGIGLNTKGKRVFYADGWLMNESLLSWAETVSTGSGLPGGLWGSKASSVSTLSWNISANVTANNDTIILVGGLSEDILDHDELAYRNEIWHGSIRNLSAFPILIDWNLVSNSSESPFLGRYGHELLAVNNYCAYARGVCKDKEIGSSALMLMGGVSEVGLLNDCWVSFDSGRTWTLVNRRAKWAPRMQFGSAQLGDSIFVFGGRGRVSNFFFSDVWRSSWEMNGAISHIGLQWEFLGKASWAPRYRFSTVFSDPRLPAEPVCVIFGGYQSGSSELFSDAWATSDGRRWFKISKRIPPGSISGASVAVLAGLEYEKQPLPVLLDASMTAVGEASLPPFVVAAGYDSNNDRINTCWMRFAAGVIAHSSATSATLSHIVLFGIISAASFTQ